MSWITLVERDRVASDEANRHLLSVASRRRKIGSNEISIFARFPVPSANARSGVPRTDKLTALSLSV